MPVFPNSLSLRQLRAFDAVAHCGAFAAAAQQLHITQSALSESIRMLEEAVGVRLFDRTTRTVGLTDAGVSFLQDVRMALEVLERGVRRMDDLGALRGGLVRIAAAPSVLAGVVLPCLPALRRRHPGIQVELHEDGAQGIADRVRKGLVDFGVGAWRAASGDGLEGEPLLSDCMGLLARPGDALLAEPHLCASQLAERAFVGLTVDTAISQLLEHADGMPASVVRPALRVSNTLLLCEAIRLGLGISIVPALTARHPLLRDLRFSPLAQPRIVRRIMVMQRARRSLSPAAGLVLEALRRKARGVGRYPGITLESAGE
ncbi:LysR family transcriptional regulator [Acidovorax sp. MR-S7]|uniref:LysR family transcriptional regulator n=1 Tax=Acidovorax sp. MR-S7 TaxID=1268622 RepID=UPI0003D3CD2A|nr:LysR family transcriptional regulator [Acidovorax sp. MR-S7]GAD24827.1 transcriptional regulator [Acidovorax sp. MR-S7]